MDLIQQSGNLLYLIDDDHGGTLGEHLLAKSMRSEEKIRLQLGVEQVVPSGVRELLFEQRGLSSLARAPEEGRPRAGSWVLGEADIPII
jgi:hypothetical protein